MLRKFISPILISLFCLCITALAPAARAGDISELFETVSVTWMSREAPDNESDLLDTAVECASEDLPARVEFRRLNEVETSTVVETVRLIYPEDTPAAQRITYVDISGLAGVDKIMFRTLFRGAVDPDDPEPEISFTPYVTRSLRIRFYHTAGGDVVLPRVALLGLENAADEGVTPDQDPVTLEYVAFDDDKPVGTYTYERRFEDDEFIYDVDTTINVKLVDADIGRELDNELVEQCQTTADEDIALDTFTCTVIKFEDKGTVTGRAMIDDLELSATGLGKDVDKVMSLKNRAPAVPWMIYDILARDGLFLGQEREFEVAVPYKLDIVRVTARVTDFFPAREGRAGLYVVWVADKGEPNFVQLALVEDDGTVLRLYDFSRRVEFWLVQDPDEWELEPMVLDLELILEEAKVRLRDFITMPDSVVQGRISIKWNEAPPESMQLESARQKVVSLEETEPGVFEAELETIRRSPGDEPLAASAAPGPDELQSYLMDDDIVETRNPKLVKLAEEIAGQETDPLLTARKIFNWLIHNLRPADVDSFFAVPASLILRRKKGDCKYFAVLFATLARIRGIPTRFAFGERYIGGSYGYHVWNQIYVNGEWLDVDASDLSFYPGGLRVQFFTGASFNEKGHTGVLLGFRPDPDILETETGEPDYSAVAGRVPSEITQTSYTDAYFNCRINFPSAFSHEIIDLGFIRKIRFYLPDDPRFSAHIYLIPKSKNEEITIAGWGGMESIHMLDLFGTIRAAKAHKFGNTAFAGGEGFFITGEFQDRNHNYLHFDLTMLELEDRTFVFHFVGDSETYRKYSRQLSYIKKALETF